ncbi:hypothetical protein DAI22_08g108200 [Oryza sativa Japonica Group]|nr:hypothetical protein DAI22_08g108200 [Oryza sativa Japonica Group]
MLQMFFMVHALTKLRLFSRVSRYVMKGSMMEYWPPFCRTWARFLESSEPLPI